MAPPVTLVNWDAMRRAVTEFENYSDQLGTLEKQVNGLKQESIEAWKGDTSNRFVQAVDDWLKGYGIVIQALNTMIVALQKALNEFHQTEGTNTSWVPTTIPNPGFGVLAN